MTRAQTQQALRRLPVKWAVALLVLIIVYALAQPALNSRLGWHLPSLARLLGEPEPKTPKQDPTRQQGLPTRTEDPSHKSETAKTKAKTQSKSNSTVADSSIEGTSGSSQAHDPTDGDEPAVASKTESTPEPATDSTSKSAKSQPKQSTKSDHAKASQPKNNPPAKGDLLYGILKEVGRERYVSIEGLQYNPGSEEGHRLKHLEKHLSDIPDRPGKHGVFDGEIKDALKWIDDAYARGKRGAKGVRKTEEENRTIYEVPFTQPIGYIGGRDGKRSGNPPAKRLRLVVEGNKFITAFPF